MFQSLTSTPRALFCATVSQTRSARNNSKCGCLAPSPRVHARGNIALRDEPRGVQRSLPVTWTWRLATSSVLLSHHYKRALIRSSSQPSRRSKVQTERRAPRQCGQRRTADWSSGLGARQHLSRRASSQLVHRVAYACRRCIDAACLCQPDRLIWSSGSLLVCCILYVCVLVRIVHIGLGEAVVPLARCRVPDWRLLGTGSPVGQTAERRAAARTARLFVNFAECRLPNPIDSTFGSFWHFGLASAPPPPRSAVDSRQSARRGSRVTTVTSRGRCRSRLESGRVASRNRRTLSAEALRALKR